MRRRKARLSKSRKSRLIRRQKNPSIQLGPRFFENAIKDYTNWKEKWWREAIQNSVDAGATAIECEVKEDTDKNYLVSILDDGKGMDRNLLLNKFLVLGETTKEHAGTVGGFGKAKELLILPWMAWTIETQNTKIVGSGANYEIHEIEPVKGTKITVKMAADKSTTALAAKTFIKKCFLPKVAFKVNNEVVPADLAVGELLKEYPTNTENKNMRIYYSQEADIPSGYRILIRTQGIFMFEDYMDKLEGVVLIETFGPSVDIFTANREGFRNPEMRREYTDFVTTLIKDVRSGLRGGSRLRKLYRSGKKFTSSLDDYSLNDSIEKLTKDVGIKSKGGHTFFDDATLEDLASLVDVQKKERQRKRQIEEDNARQASDFEREKEEPGDAGNQFITKAATVEMTMAMLDDVRMSGEGHIEAAVKQLLWEPDFFLINEIKEFTVPEQFYPETMSLKVQRLSRLWAELCRFVLIQLGSDKKFGVGFKFSYTNSWTKEYAMASYAREANEDWLVLNPYYHGNPENDIYDINDDEHLDMLYAFAVHECTHIADEIAYHDEDFSSAITTNMARTFRGRKNLRPIRDAIIKVFRAEPKKSKLAKGKGYYKVVVPGKRGRASTWNRLGEAENFADTKYPESLVKIEAWFKPEGGEDQLLDTVEYRKNRQSYEDDGMYYTAESLDRIYRIRRLYDERNWNDQYNIPAYDAFLFKKRLRRR